MIYCAHYVSMPIINNYVKARMITFYMRLINGKHTKLSYIMYKVSRCKCTETNDFQCKWLAMIKNVLISLEMGDIWFQEGMSYTTEFVKRICKDKIKESFCQEWKNDVLAHNYCDIYCTFKSSWCFENYLTKLNYYNRVSLSKFRCRSNYLPISRSRFNDYNINDILCPLCESKDIGNETHYIFKCPFFDEHRKKYLDVSVLENVNEQSLKALFDSSSEQLIKVAI